ncbi:hypothetical protein T484DRAFT_1762070 [Baffinella frigidus]|nr:hypothetical protein T484DRAFT_1762070 [Cryptophyta sp. CCMP2293]
MANFKAGGGFLPPLRRGQAVAVVLTAALGLALVAVLLQDAQAGAGGVAVLESSGERIARLETESKEMSMEARIRRAAAQLEREDARKLRAKVRVVTHIQKSQL